MLVDGSESRQLHLLIAIGLSDGDAVYASSNDMGWGVEKTFILLVLAGSSLLGYSTSENDEGRKVQLITYSTLITCGLVM